MDNIFHEEEKLYRLIIPKNWYFEEDRISSAAFKDSKGLSVDRDGDRKDIEIINSFFSRFNNENIEAIACIDVKTCIDLNTYLKYAPTDDNIYHSEIHDSINRITLSPSKAKKLADKCSIPYKR